MKNYCIIILLLLSSASGSFSQTNTFPTSGNVGIGTTSPNAKISFNNMNDGSDGADGITWYNSDRLLYGIYRTPGPWVSPDFQQLKLSFSTGIVLDPGTAYGKSFVDIQGGGLRVSSGNVGIGTSSAPAYKLDVYSPADWKAKFHGDNGYILFGPANEWWAHIYTDRPHFLFNQDIYSSGGFSSYNAADLSLQTHGITRLTISKATGHVGISTNAPSARLNVQQSSGAWNDGIRLSLMNKHWDIVADSNGDRLIIAKDQNMGNGIVLKDGNVGIGSASPTEKLTVDGTIYGKEVRVDLSVPGPDYVFSDDYKLPTLEEVKNYIAQHKHLSEVPSAKEMEENGIELGAMNMVLLKKVEELTLYVIELKEKNEQAEERMNDLQTELEELKHN